MSTDKTPLVSKLILIVLVLILGCLIILVVQQSSKPWNPSESTVSYMDDSATPARTEPVSYLPVTNRAITKPKLASNTRPSAGRATERSAAEAAGPSASTPAGQFGDSTYAYPGVPAGALDSSYGGATTSPAGISGRVWLTGVPPPEIPIHLEGTTCGSLHLQPFSTRHYVVTHDGGLANVFVYIKQGLENVRFPVPTNQPVLNNQGCLFEPYVMGLQTRQKFTIENSDLILHNIHATPKNNQEFNLAINQKTRASTRNVLSPSFPKPEVFVRVKCDVHPWMFAYVGVVSHPFFAVTDAEGTFRFPPGLPEGKYLVAAVHPKAGESVQEITVAANEPKVLNFNLAVPSPQQGSRNY